MGVLLGHLHLRTFEDSLLPDRLATGRRRRTGLDSLLRIKVTVIELVVRHDELLLGSARILAVQFFAVLAPPLVRLCEVLVLVLELALC